MFFSAYLGGEAGFTPWEQAVAWHAHQLGLTSRVERRTLAGADHLGLAWLEHEARRLERHLVETDHVIAARTHGAAVSEDLEGLRPHPWDALARATDANAIKLTASVTTGEVSVLVPPTTPQQIYVTRRPDGWIVADDLRFFRHLADTVLDARAVYTLLQYSSIPPSLTLYRNVERVPNGHRLRVRRDSPTAGYVPFFHPTELPRAAGGELDAERRIQETLDANLAAAPVDSVLYFSGGVDSGLMAARLAHLGRRDVRLVNYAFDATDEEHLLAVRMATHLGFKCELIPQMAGQAADVLDRAGREYSFPFGDISTIPTNTLVHGSLPWIPSAGTVIEGTGADGAYGLAAGYPRWRRTYNVPRRLRRLIGSAYRRLDLWRFDSRVERIGRFVRKSAELPLPHAVIGQNALAGIAYDLPQLEPEGLAAIASERFDAIALGSTPLDRLSLLDLMWVCAGRMAPKSFDPLRMRGIHAVYPFLEPSMLSVSTVLPWETKCAGGQGKAILKRMLARDVPEAWVFRRKTGFTRAASSRAIFASAPIQEYLNDVVLSAQNPLRDFYRLDVVRRLADRARHHSLSVGAHIFLWTLAFASGWVRGQPTAHPQPGWTPDPKRHAGPGHDRRLEGGRALER